MINFRRKFLEPAIPSAHRLRSQKSKMVSLGAAKVEDLAVLDTTRYYTLGLMWLGANQCR